MPETDEKPKRVISIGFIKPETLEEDVIYVCLKPFWGVSESGNCGATAFSNELFWYRQKLIEAGDFASNMTHSEEEGFQLCAPHYRIFINKLEKENNAQLEDRFFKDGLELYRKLEEIERLANIR